MMRLTFKTGSMLLLALLPFLFASCSSGKFGRSPALANQELSAKPDFFQATSGNYFVGQTQVELQADGSLLLQRERYTESDKSSIETKKLTVSEKQWQEFRKELNKAKVWQWKQRYEAKDMNGASHWDLQIRYPEQSMSSSGFVAYPSHEQYQLYHAAVEKLLGGQEF